MSAASATNEASVSIRKGPLVGPVLGRVVGMLAARAQCPIDRLDDAMLLTDAVAAHAPTHTTEGRVQVVVAADQTGIELRVGALARGGADSLLADAELPGVGNVFTRVADEVVARSAGDGAGELILRLRFVSA
jgi:serine/threonine-protein kinase RsbW